VKHLASNTQRMVIATNRLGENSSLTDWLQPVRLDGDWLLLPSEHIHCGLGSYIPSSKNPDQERAYVDMSGLTEEVGGK
jgi:hypothetical protein